MVTRDLLQANTTGPRSRPHRARLTRQQWQHGRTYRQPGHSGLFVSVPLSEEELRRLDEVSVTPLLYAYWYQARTSSDRLSPADPMLLGPYLRLVDMCVYLRAGAAVCRSGLGRPERNGMARDWRVLPCQRPKVLHTGAAT